jgi:hypothetical protein
MVEYYKTNKGYCYKKTKKYGCIRISLEDYKKAMSKNGGVKRKLNNNKVNNNKVNNVKVNNINVTSRNSRGQVTVTNTNRNNNINNNRSNIPGTLNNLESGQQIKKKLNQTEMNRRKEIINAPRTPEEEKRRKNIVANILSNKNKGLPLNIANRIANMSREQPPPPRPTHAGIQMNSTNNNINALLAGI